MVNESPELPAVKEIESLEALKATTDSQRHRILCLLIDEPLTPGEIAEKLKIKRTRVYYHLDLLVKHGMIGVVSERRVAAVTERTYRAAARAFRVNRKVLAASATGAQISAVQASILDHAADDLRTSTDPELLTSRGFLELSPEDAQSLRAELVAVIDSYRQRSAPGGLSYELAIALFQTETAS